MICGACRHENRSDSRFCLRCGAELDRLCGRCGRQLPPDARYCDGCGATLPPRPAGAGGPAREPRAYTPAHLAERILTTKAALEGERKHVTVLFADLADSTALAERIGAEEMHALLDRAFAIMLGEVHRYEGTVNQFTGDGIMALFGAPLALEDAPRRAVTAALGIQRALEPLDGEVRERHGSRFQLRIGIHSGPVVVGRIGDDLRMDYTAVGDTTNLAARLQGLARPGVVLISAATEHSVSGFFELRDLGAVGVKGRSQPVHCFEVTGERAARTRIEAAAPAGLTPFVGRGGELDSLQAAFEAARGGSGRVAFLVGDAGIGKSRLLYEFRRRVADDAPVWFEGRCASYGRNSAFYPLVDALRRYLAIEDGDDDARAGERLRRAAGEDLAWALPFLSALLSLPCGAPEAQALDAGSRRSETFRALRALLLRESQRGVLVFVIEDLHWIDPASEEFLRFLSESIPASRALLVFSHRPGYRQPAGDHSYHLRVALQSLSGAEMAEMARALLCDALLPEELRRLVTDRAEGNPFFVEEVVQSLLEQGVLRAEAGRVVYDSARAELAVPNSIQDVLTARIDRLAEAPKRAMQVASVIGREFALRLLARIDEAGDRVSEVVEELRSLELVYEKAAHPELAFMFKHALTHDVAYQSILRERRRALHRIVGSAIEELYPERLAEHYEALAHHFAEGEDWERAFRYHARAAQKASDAYANQAAALHCRRALEIADRLEQAAPEEELARLEQLLGFSHWLLSEYRASAEAWERAARHSADDQDRALRLCWAAHCLTWAHDYEASRRASDQALALGRQQGLPAAEGMALMVAAFQDVVLDGDVERYRDASDRALSLGRRGGDEVVAAHGEFYAGEFAEWCGDYPGALDICERTLERGRRLHMPHLVVFASWFAGKAACCLGRYGEAMQRLEQAADFSERLGDRVWRSRLLNTLGWCCAEFGAYEPARRFNERALVLALEIGDLEILANARINLANDHLAQGGSDEARAQLERIRGELDADDPWMRWRYSLHLLDLEARIAIDAGNPARALELTGEELRGARRHRAPKLEARALELRGRALALLERRGEAREALEAALAGSARIGHPPVQWRARSGLVLLARREGERAEAERHEQELRRLLEATAPTLRDTGLRPAFDALAARLLG